MKTQSFLKSPLSISGLKVKLIAFLVLGVSTGFVWMAADQTIAPPVVRTLDLLWRLFVCRCFFQFDLLH
jgi:hypothetical protein